ncbi:hypothetical protein LSAT2_015386 [Lamellibrachia satsuma]|nr:hypothetical protein LSAT2_015386 [Lamellibrachia satsuma]
MAFDDFVLDHWRNDIALVKMRDTVPLGSDIFPQIQSVTLPERGDTAFPADAARCTMHSIHLLILWLNDALTHNLTQQLDLFASNFTFRWSRSQRMNTQLIEYISHRF